MNTDGLILKFNNFSKEEQEKIIAKNFSDYPDYYWWKYIDLNIIPKATECGILINGIKDFDLEERFITLNIVHVDIKKFAKHFYNKKELDITSKRNLFWYYDNGFTNHILANEVLDINNNSTNLFYVWKVNEKLLKHKKICTTNTLNKLNTVVKNLNQSILNKVREFEKETLKQLYNDFYYLKSNKYIEDLCESNNYYFNSKTLELVYPYENIFNKSNNFYFWIDNGFICTSTICP